MTDDEGMRVRAMLVLSIGLTTAGNPATAMALANGGVQARLPLLGWLAAPFLALFPATQPLVNSAPLDRERGGCELTLDVDDHGSALFLELSGRCRFASAAIEYADGARDSLDLHQVTRGSGLYLLHPFDGDRGVRRVTLGVQALSTRAYVGARLMR